MFWLCKMFSLHAPTFCTIYSSKELFIFYSWPFLYQYDLLYTLQKTHYFTIVHCYAHQNTLKSIKTFASSAFYSKFPPYYPDPVAKHSDTAVVMYSRFWRLNIQSGFFYPKLNVPFKAALKFYLLDYCEIPLFQSHSP